MYAQSQVNKNINCALWCKKCKMPTVEVKILNWSDYIKYQNTV